MPTFTIADDLMLFYEDSGPLSSDIYTTLIFFHGIGFNGAVFRKLFDSAERNNFRIVSVYRPGYAPSTSVREADLKLLLGNLEEQTKYMQEQGMMVGKFIDEFLIHESIPPARNDKRGGIALVGWSLGSPFVHAFLSNVDMLPPQGLARLEKYIHTIIIHEANAYLLGLPFLPAHTFMFWSEPDVHKRFSLFKDWVTGYYLHKEGHSGKSSELAFNTHTDRPNTFHDSSTEELSELESIEGLIGPDHFIRGIRQEVVRETIRRSIFDKSLASYFPNLCVRYLAGAEAPGVLVWALYEMQKVIDNPESYGGEKARDAKTVFSPTGNHFVFWDDPEEAFAQYLRCIEV